ncbi:MAG: STAS domain-containing protein [Nitrosospira sp.]|nr:STAS domain-containing protein [Nitrosospira sp.]
MILCDGNKLKVQGPINASNVLAVVEQGVALFEHSDLVIDLAQVTEVDSSAVSMLLEWQRRTNTHNQRLFFSNIPVQLKNLAELYGVYEMIVQM